MTLKSEIPMKVGQDNMRLGVVSQRLSFAPC